MGVQGQAPKYNRPGKSEQPLVTVVGPLRLAQHLRSNSTLFLLRSIDSPLVTRFPSLYGRRHRLESFIVYTVDGCADDRKCGFLFGSRRVVIHDLKGDCVFETNLPNY